MKAEGISNLQATHEENKDGCFSSATDWVHLKVLGENKSLWFLALIAQAYAHAPNPVISWNYSLFPFFHGFQGSSYVLLIFQKKISQVQQ